MFPLTIVCVCRFTRDCDVQELEEYSQAMEEERYYIGEQLKEMESEVENERQMRDELARRLESLQSKVTQLCPSALLYSV